MEDNILEYLTSVPTESDCKSLCRNRTGCFYYTYYLEDDPHQGTCILLTSIIEPTEECQTCVTGKVALKIFSNYENTGEFVLVYNPIRCPKSMSGVTRINDRSYWLWRRMWIHLQWWETNPYDVYRTRKLGIFLLIWKANFFRPTHQWRKIVTRRKFKILNVRVFSKVFLHSFKTSIHFGF